MKIVHYPHPALRHVARPVPTIDRELRLRAGEMADLMYEAKGLALAATQVALPLQLLVMNMTGDPQQKELEAVYLNPVIVERKGIQEGEEGCLSFPGMYQKVRRAKTVRVHAYSLEGKLVDFAVSDLAARAWQHELDHLNGILYIDKMGPLAKLACRGEIKEFERQFRRAQERGEIPPDAQIEQYLKELETKTSP
jgi:peptide deformylase